MLVTVFKADSETKFDAVDTDVIRGRKAIAYDFVTTKDRAQQVITSAGRVTTDSTTSGIKGRVSIDRSCTGAQDRQRGGRDPGNVPGTLGKTLDRL